MIIRAHNVHHAYMIGDRFTVLHHGRSMGTFDKGEISVAELEKMMAGGKELDQLSTELDGVSRPE